MANPQSVRAIYKLAEGQEIDARIHLPATSAGARAQYPVLFNVHGGAFMLGSANMVNRDQVQDCLDRGWIVVVPNHRLCPQVNMLEGPMQDCRDLLAWIRAGHLETLLANETQKAWPVDQEHIFSFGTSSGGHLALCLGFGVPKPVAGIYDMYGVCCFSDPAWANELPHIQAILPPMTADFLNQVFSEKPVPTESGVSLEGQAPGPPDFSSPREAFAFTQIAQGTVMDALWPSKDFGPVDPALNITSAFPPTIIVHGQSDRMVPIDLSRQLYQALQKHGVQSKLVEIPNEDHTFAARMKRGSETWNLQRQGFDFLESLLAEA